MLLGDMVVQTANSPGTGMFNLIAPPNGRSTFVSQAGAGQVFYFAEDSSSWEKGVGTVVSGSPDTLSRDSILGNSLGTTARVNFASTVTIICDIPAERSLWASADNSAVLVGSRRLSGVLAAVAVDDGARFSQLGNIRAQTISPSGGAITIAMPTILAGDTYQLVEIDLRAITASADTAYYLRLSTDGGNSYQNGSTDYFCSLNILFNGAISGNAVQGAYAQITGTMTGNFAMQGKIRFDLATAQWDTNFVGAYSGSYARSLGAGNAPRANNATHMVIGAVNQNITGGLARVSRIGF